MLLKMKQALSGPELSLMPGQVHDFAADEAARLIAAGIAVQVGEAEKTEQATAPKRAKSEKRG